MSIHVVLSTICAMKLFGTLIMSLNQLLQGATQVQARFFKKNFKIIRTSNQPPCTNLPINFCPSYKLQIMTQVLQTSIYATSLDTHYLYVTQYPSSCTSYSNYMFIAFFSHNLPRVVQTMHSFITFCNWRETP